MVERNNGVGRIMRPVRVGVNQWRTVYLVADQDDLERGEINGNARMEYTNGFVGEIMPLQQFYKFGNWYPVEDKEGVEDAME